MLARAARANQPDKRSSKMPSAAILRTLCQVWERIVLELYGEAVMPYIDNFGRYIVLRQKAIFQSYGKMKDYIDLFHNIRSRKLYGHDYFDHLVSK